MVDELRQLVKRCLVGDQSAMQAFVRRYQGQIYGLCYRMLGHHQDAEDTAQEAFVRVLGNLHRWDPEREIEPWMLAIAANRCRTALARRNRRPPLQTMIEAPDHSATQQHQANHLAEEVQKALDTLRPEHRLAFVLFHQHELSYEQIADSAQRPLGTVKTWIHRARLELIRILQHRDVLQETRHAVP